ncbi:hypothetical protein J5N97_011772 [Dioscorea zingiberensis]|uniref:non-specific serine/threonine protein kinase n=1 Tax=Dioscorea zingiberensis TaxID=325984 RepID=A0A9D5D3B5_9LILI|nr:hypothetical protein J5N97_011772 [Dioscorea zingiberensis]
MDLQGAGPQLTLWFGSAKKWLSGPLLDVSGFTNTPELSTLDGFTYWYNYSMDEVYYMFGPQNPKSLSRWTANQFGKVERLLWNESISTWNLVLNLPKSQCDEYSQCGPYGLCDLNSSPICSCLRGFRPKTQQEWDQRDLSSGCVRLTALDCKNRTVGFMTVTHTSLPDTAMATCFHTTISLDECRQKCLTNCSCTGYASADIYGRGCIIWVSELVGVGTVSYGRREVYVRLASADLASIAHHQHEKDIRGDDELELPQLQWSTVMAATGNFAAENILGKGGFGPVYKGKLEGKEIAVKRLSRNSTQGVDEFKNEVILIAKLQHRNLVRLFGYCIQGEERMLIYEYMPNGSLDAFLFDKEKGVHLDWQARWRIIVGIARGLMYLHQDSRFRIIHRDLKASNILLDSAMNPKISDFGLARISGENESMTITRKVVGTFGYMAPEYALDGIFSVKSDVFSFGVLVLEIISGQRSRVSLSQPHLFLLGNNNAEVT